MSEGESLPDDLRCNRTDGRQWRCKRRVLEGKKLCDIHYMQGRHRQMKQKVPDSLKFERARKMKKAPDKGHEIGVSRREKTLKVVRKLKAAAKRKRCVSEALDEALKRMELKRGDLPLELIRVFLKRQVEKKKQKELKNESDASVELMRELPNAVMAIPNLPSNNLNNGGFISDVKLGADPFSARQFRSKNIEPPPITTLQAVPFAKNLKKVKRKKCHWCRRTNYRVLVKCLSCKKQFFCMDCIKERHLEKPEIKAACPVCRGSCSCRICTKTKSKAINFKEFYRDKKRVNKTRLLYYLIHSLLPVLEKINQEQSIELEIEANISGKENSEVQIQQAAVGLKKLYCCSNCKTSVLDYHRSCLNCSFVLCINCCSELRQRYECSKSNGASRGKSSDVDDDNELTVSMKQTSTSRLRSSWTQLASSISLCNWEPSIDGSISCPPTESGGCSGGFLHLRCLFPCNWFKELEISAQATLCHEKYEETKDASGSCSPCKEGDHKDCGVNNLLVELAQRLDTNDNFLYCPTLKDLWEEDFENFQKHWGKGHPVIVRNVLRSSSELSWDPVFMFCTYLEKRSKCPKNKEATKAPNSLDWCEVEIARKQVFMGSLQWQTHAAIRQQMIKFRAWLSSHLFEEQFPVHYLEILRALPLQEYMNPNSSLLNLAVKLPGEMASPDLGPSIYISYGGSEELVRTEFTTNLCYESYDVVNILAYATDTPISKEQLCKVKTLMKTFGAKDQRECTSNSTDQRGKSSLQSEDTEESGLQDVNGEHAQLPDAIAKVPFYSADSHKGQTFGVDDSNLLSDSDCDSGSDSEGSILCSESVDRLTDSDIDDFFHDSLESSNTHGTENSATICGAQWDIFRRQDVPKLLEYLRRHSKEFISACSYSKQPAHPILDQDFFLDAYHKLKLKEEFDVQPWTFDQHPGEAVIIPAGCPYQIRQLKSCVNIVLNFLSPENAAECIHLSDEIRLLPAHHKARRKLMEVKKMAVCGIRDAVGEIHDITTKLPS
ncbi:lysine-specific demethylase JMJ25 isoform X1 [Ipomoea triloba]|uniref:lysine-specific demethylase JMJ25 isoform X1 n=1 Tax=Ipomoea triloba TaxID=35885 RepID=UPI00125DBAA4|nr:lysine-specific demethylase JMJ25 isoform X1 [Ipomoea triloba]XP_031126033.1 lysine-specific demethylase JMJ25 isoform X1 [Ipomoea triloba]